MTLNQDGSCTLNPAETEAVRKVLAKTSDENMAEMGLSEDEIDLALEMMVELTDVKDAEALGLMAPAHKAANENPPISLAA